MGASVRPDTTSVNDPVAAYLAARDSAQKANASDPVADYLAAKQVATSHATAVPKPPGVVSRTLSSLANTAKQAALHPIDTAESIIAAPIKSALTANRFAAEQDAENAVASSGGPIGAVPRTVTPKQGAVASLQTAANLAAPEIDAAVPTKIGGRAAAGAVVGAAYNPKDPIVGAATGAVVTPLAAKLTELGAGAVDLGKTARRVRSAPDLGEAAVQHEQDIKATNAVNYGAVEAQGKANPTTPALTDALNHPTIKPVADAFRASSVGNGATDAETARSVDKLMTTQRRGIQKRMESKEGNYDYNDALQIEQIKSAQKVLRSAIASPSTKSPLTLDVPDETTVVEPTITPGREPMSGPVLEGTAGRARGNQSQVAVDANGRATAVSPRDVQGPAGPAFQLRAQPDVVKPGVTIQTPAMRIQTAPAEDVPASMESYPDAIGDMARMKGERDAFNTAADQTRAVLNQTSVRGKKLSQVGGPAFLNQIWQLPPNEAQAATLGTLGRTKEMTAPRPITDHATAFGTVVNRLVRPLTQINAIRPYVSALDEQSGRGASPIDLKAALRRAALVNAGLAPTDSTTP